MGHDHIPVYILLTHVDMRDSGMALISLYDYLSTDHRKICNPYRSSRVGRIAMWWRGRRDVAPPSKK